MAPRRRFQSPEHLVIDYIEVEAERRGLLVCTHQDGTVGIGGLIYPRPASVANAAEIFDQIDARERLRVLWEIVDRGK